MKIKSVISAINKHLTDVFNLFGGRSEEYMNALKQVRDNLPDNVLQQTQTQGLNYAYDTPREALKLSAGKKSQEILQNFEADLIKVRQEQKESGSAIVQAQKYIDDLAKDGLQFSRQRIKEKASGLYDFRNNVNDWYKDVDKSNLSEAEKSNFKEAYSELNGADPYEYAVLRQKIDENYNRLKPKLEEERRLRKAAEEEAQNAIESGMEIDPLSQI